MVTRRNVLGAGLAVASLASSAGFGSPGATGHGRGETRSIDALLVDDTIEMPRQTVALIRARSGTLPVVGVRLDAAAHAGLTFVLKTSRDLVGLSCGATLFCLERIAWDHGFRLTGRSERRISDSGDEAWRQEVAEYLSGRHPRPASALTLACAYRPSRADGTLHVWALQKSIRPPFARTVGRSDHEIAA